MDLREIVNGAKEAIELAEDVLDTGDHIKSAKNRIESGEVAQEMEKAREVRCKEDALWDVFQVLWMIMLTVTIIIVKFL